MAALRKVPPTDTERHLLWLALACTLAVLILLAALLGGCAAPQVECPLGTMPLWGLEQRAASGSGSASVSVPTASGSGSGGYQTTGSATVRCGSICGSRCMRAHDDGKTRAIECYECSAPRRDGGP